MKFQNISLGPLSYSAPCDRHDGRLNNRVNCIYSSFANSTFWSSGVQEFSLRLGVTDNRLERNV